MKRLLLALALSFGLSAIAEAKVEVRNGKFWFNGERQEMVWGRSCFKLANQVTYHYTGQGGGHWGLHSAREFVDFHMVDLGVPEGFVCRVFLETAAWSPCEVGADTNNGKPDSCMFGSEPRDQGFWNGSDWNVQKEQTNRDQLRDGNRQRSLDPVGEKVIEWFYKTSEESGMAFELIVNATTKHDRIPVSEIDHIIRQAGVFMGEEMEAKYPRAVVIANWMNEWSAHSQATVDDVNMWAVRTHRDNYFPHSDHPIMVDGGGANRAAYDVGREDGKYRSYQIHPERGAGWETYPSPAEMQRLRNDARGMPVGANESMYYVSANGRNGTENTLGWYRPGGRTANFADYKKFLDWQLDINAVRDGFDYFIIHDDKGAQSQKSWPRGMTEVDRWIMANLGGNTPPPPTCDPVALQAEAEAACAPHAVGSLDTVACTWTCNEPPPPGDLEYDHVINSAFSRILLRDADLEGLSAYNEWLIECFAQAHEWQTEYHCLAIMDEALVRSDEYADKFKN